MFLAFSRRCLKVSILDRSLPSPLSKFLHVSQGSGTPCEVYEVCEVNSVLSSIPHNMHEMNITTAVFPTTELTSVRFINDARDFNTSEHYDTSMFILALSCPNSPRQTISSPWSSSSDRSRCSRYRRTNLPYRDRSLANRHFTVYHGRWASGYIFCLLFSCSRRIHHGRLCNRCEVFRAKFLV